MIVKLEETMKELSIEEKAKRYDEAIKKAKSKIKNDKDHVLYEDDVIEMFPEIAESEDEKIRKWIKNVLESIYVTDNIVNDVMADKALAWFERQGEKGAKGNEREIPNHAWSGEDEDNMMMIEDRLSDYLDYIREDTSLTKHQKNSMKEEVIGYVNWLKSLKGRAKPQPTWKPSDEQMHYLSWIANIKLGDSVVEQEVSKHLNELLEDLKKLKGE